MTGFARPWAARALGVTAVLIAAVGVGAQGPAEPQKKGLVAQPAANFALHAAAPAAAAPTPIAPHDLVILHKPAFAADKLAVFRPLAGDACRNAQTRSRLLAGAGSFAGLNADLPSHGIDWNLLGRSAGFRAWLSSKLSQAFQLAPDQCEQRFALLMAQTSTASDTLRTTGTLVLPGAAPPPPPPPVQPTEMLPAPKPDTGGDPAPARGLPFVHLPQPTAAPPPTPAPAATPAPDTATPPPPAATPTVDFHDPAVAAAVSRLPNVPVTYNKPQALKYDEDTEVSLIIASADLQAARKDISGFSGPAAETTARLAPQVEAYLTGPPDDVVITLRPGSTPAQTLSEIGNVQWIWDVKARHPGRTTLTVEVWTTMTLGADAHRARVKVLRDQFPITASPLRWVAYQVAQIDPIWKWITGAIATVIAILTSLGIVKSRQKKKGGED